jgi:hypothetical protein
MQEVGNGEGRADAGDEPGDARRGDKAEAEAGRNPQPDAEWAGDELADRLARALSAALSETSLGPASPS